MDTSLARRRRSFVRPLGLALGVVLLAGGLLVAGWTLFILLRPTPPGFAPSAGEATGVVGQLPNVLQYTIDARSRSDWVYFEFSQGTVVTASQEGLDWDLAFRRTDILTNSGDTNPRGAAGAVDLGEVPLEQAAPTAAGYQADTTHEERGVENPALHKWYNYNWTVHTITSKNHTYALQTGEGPVVLLTFVSYYCDDGSAGCVTIRYRQAEGP